VHLAACNTEHPTRTRVKDSSLKEIASGRSCVQFAVISALLLKFQFKHSLTQSNIGISRLETLKYIKLSRINSLPLVVDKPTLGYREKVKLVNQSQNWSASQSLQSLLPTTRAPYAHYWHRV